MKRILIPTSFSLSSANALRCAYALDSGAKLTLLNAYPVQEYNRKYDFGTKRYEIGIQKKLIEFYHQQLDSPSGKPSFLAIKGVISEVVNQISTKYDLIVMSRKVHPSKQNDYLGSKVPFIIAKAQCPVLIMPLSDIPFSFQQCQKIWYIKRNDTASDRIAKGISKLGIAPGLMEEKSLKQQLFKSSLWQNIVAFSKSHDKALLTEITKSHEDEQIDLLVIIHHDQSPFINFLKGDVMTAFSLFNIPLLVFPVSD